MRRHKLLRATAITSLLLGTRLAANAADLPPVPPMAPRTPVAYVPAVPMLFRRPLLCPMTYRPITTRSSR